VIDELNSTLGPVKKPKPEVEWLAEIKKG